MDLDLWKDMALEDKLELFLNYLAEDDIWAILVFDAVLKSEVINIKEIKMSYELPPYVFGQESPVETLFFESTINCMKDDAERFVRSLENKYRKLCPDGEPVTLFRHVSEYNQSRCKLLTLWLRRTVQ